MQEDFYPFSLSHHKLRYEFVSVSTIKEIRKVVTLDLTTSANTYNLALLDTLDSGKLSDLVESNNNDLSKVLATIFQIIENFFRKCPKSLIAFRGSDERRQRLYRIVITRELSKIVKKFEVYGSIENQIFLFEPNIEYDFYLISKL
ncbi:DUF6934 family protein [Dyadobacter fanqingshengii]|uniref:Uncharacterized protein n=1 Tax=Dyadobacter fanqingshengii TaxID=2906443 RepID=A0A9X1P633_9BACT|nr:hypothetical protein [Dyadobacter fanqingshengii]MCF0039421.1 hypothetical protein [Dyadobacter fanqingshengii]USJ33767.1 hypothetical protein NFI81_13715 [Dyadobacter fanqingshengii]